MSNYLYHHGILGMHWGHRKGPAVTTRTSRPTSEDHIKSRGLGAHHSSQLSSDEMKTIVQRMNLEKQYKELTKQEVSPGRKFVTDIISNAGKQVATKYTAQYMEKMLKKVLKDAAKP